MKKAIFTLLLSTFFLAGYTQLVNNGGNINVESGATLVIEGDYTSSSAGDILIDGNVELKGDLINNSGTINAASTGTLKFNGTAQQEITGPATTVFNVDVVVDNAAGVALTNTVTGNDQQLVKALTLTNGTVTLNEFDLEMGTSVSGASSSNYIVTNSTGQLKGTVAASDVAFPVGNTAYNPVTLNNAGTSDTYGVIASETLPTNWIPSSHAVSRTWVVSESVAGGSDLTVTPQWNGTEEQASFDNSDCAVGQTADDGTTFAWGTASAAAGGDPYTQTGSGFTGVGKFVVGDFYFAGIDLALNLFLAGPYNGATMNTGLTVPTTDPYGLSTTVSSVPANTVDWVEVDLLDGTTPDATSPIASYACFLRNDGTLLNADGTEGAKLTGVDKASYYVAIRHRNHLGVCTGSAIDFSAAGPFAFDFTLGSSIYGTNAMRNMGSGVYALWAGDANGDGQVIYQGAGNDPTPIGNEVSSDPGNTGNSFTYIVNGYSNNDINLDGQVIYQGAGNDPTPIGNTVSSHPGNTGNSFTYAVTEQLP